jgi:hypothetical protein
MRSLRRLGLVLWLALALVAGQQVVVLHDIGHATEHAATQDEPGTPAKCEHHSACAQLAGALASAGFSAAFVASAPPRAAAVAAREASLAPRRNFLSRAPPLSLA